MIFRCWSAVGSYSLETINGLPALSCRVSVDDCGHPIKSEINEKKIGIDQRLMKLYENWGFLFFDLDFDQGSFFRELGRVKRLDEIMLKNYYIGQLYTRRVVEKRNKLVKK